MRIALLAFLSTTFAPLLAQDILHYKFDDGCNTQVLNYALGSPLGDGTLVSTMPGAPATAWVNGRWGSAMSGSSGAAAANRVNTGWVGTHTGSISFSFWIQNRVTSPTIAFGYVFGSGTPCRMFTGSSGKLFMGGWGGGATLQNAANITSLLNAGWVHVMLVLDATAATATYYINGVADPAIALTSPVSFTVSSFAVGAMSATSTSSCSFDIDDFLVTTRALTSVDALILSTYPQAGHRTYGTGNGPFLGATGGQFGAPTFALSIQDPSGLTFALVSGVGRCSIGGLPIPFDLGLVLPSFAGTLLWNDLSFLTTPGAVMSGGLGLQPLPVPNVTSIAGFTSNWQAIVLDTSAMLRGSNGIALSAGI